MTVTEVKDVVRPTRTDAASARDADLDGRGPVHGAWAGVAVTATVLLAWIGAGFHSGRGLVVDWLPAAVLGWAAVAALGGLLLLLAWLLKRVPTRLLAFGAAGTVVVGGADLWNAAWLGPIVAGVLLVAGGLAGAGVGILVRRGHGSPLHTLVAVTTAAAAATPPCSDGRAQPRMPHQPSASPCPKAGARCLIRCCASPWPTPARRPQPPAKLQRLPSTSPSRRSTPTAAAPPKASSSSSTSA